LSDLARDVAAVRFAGWLHDVVYDPTRHDNEAASAAYAREVLPALGVPKAVIAETARLIELTAGHAVAPDDANGVVLADADLAIPGAEPARYACYARDIRMEYAHVPDELFLPGRARILEGFLARPRLFLPDRMHARLDARARANLGAELERLR